MDLNPPDATRALPRRSSSSPRTRYARFATVAVPLCCVALAKAAVGCGAGRSQIGAQSADQQSVAEYDLGRDSFQNGRLREALDHVEKALKLDDENADAAHLGAIVLLGFCSHDERSSDCRYPDAERYARRAVAANAELRDARNTLGVILVHEKKLDEAIATLKPLANDILYNSPEKAWGNLGLAYLERGNADEAIDALGRAVAAQPLFCVGQYRLGLAFEKKGELSAARDAFTKALETDHPDCHRLQEAYDARARVGGKLGQRDEARADLERCRDIASSTPVGKRCAAALGAVQ